MWVFVFEEEFLDDYESFECEVWFEEVFVNDINDVYVVLKLAISYGIFDEMEILRR